MTLEEYKTVLKDQGYKEVNSNTFIKDRGVIAPVLMVKIIEDEKSLNYIVMRVPGKVNKHGKLISSATIESLTYDGNKLGGNWILFDNEHFVVDSNWDIKEMNINSVLSRGREMRLEMDREEEKENVKKE